MGVGNRNKSAKQDFNIIASYLVRSLGKLGNRVPLALLISYLQPDFEVDEKPLEIQN